MRSGLGHLLGLLLLPALAAAGEPGAAASADPLADLERQIELRVPRGAGPSSAPTVRERPRGESAARVERTASTPALVEHEYPVPHTHPEPHLHLHWHSILEPFEQLFIRRAVVSGILAGGICAWLGLFVVLRRMVFVGIALAQVAAAGVALAVFTALDPISVALATTLTVSCWIGLSTPRRATSPEARVGLLYAAAGSLAIILLAKSATGEGEQLEMLQGSLLAVPPGRVMELVVLALFVGLLHVAGFSRLVAVSFDPLTAQVAGVRIWLWNLILLLTLGTGISISIQMCGLLLVFGYMLLPAMAGLATGLRLPGVLTVALGCQALSTIAGIWLAYEADWPPGPAIVLTMLAFLAVVVPVIRATLARSRRSPTTQAQTRSPGRHVESERVSPRDLPPDRSRASETSTVDGGSAPTAIKPPSSA
ncbi:MAG: metal ABC transporter permease [Candidatus Riflebacteria bacterium]|nr:metal ABC transporter permease [Candidatus Riflebacteria bacterium]